MARRAIDPNSNFELAVMGYNRQQVDRHLDQLNQRLADAVAAFDAAVALQNQLNDARTEIRTLREAPQRTGREDSVGERITTILQAAEEQAAAIRAQAEQDAEALRAARLEGRELSPAAA